MNEINKVDLIHSEDSVCVYVNGIEIGTIALTINPLHSRNIYISLNLNSYDVNYSRPIFKKLTNDTMKSLQAMISSDDEQIIDFLIAGDFACKRKCFEIEGTPESFLCPVNNVGVLIAYKDTDIYRSACKLMYNRYIDTHKNISPWTGSYSDFRDSLPDHIAYDTEGCVLKNFAFIEDNEIAYVYGNESDSFHTFAISLVSYLLSKQDTVFFEADDCDEYAMILKLLFSNRIDASYDTYILEI